MYTCVSSDAEAQCRESDVQDTQLMRAVCVVQREVIGYMDGRGELTVQGSELCLLTFFSLTSNRTILPFDCVQHQNSDQC
jgi:hypothetical protein